MFDSLTERMQDVFRKIRGEARLSEGNIAGALEEIRAALLDADVNMAVADEFVAKIRGESLGAEVLRSVTPGQQFVKIVHDRLVGLMGEEESPLSLEGSPAVIMMVGLHGSGKTTTAAKLAVLLKKKFKKTLLAACDIYRPAAIDQLEILGRETDTPVYSERGVPDAARIAANAYAKARADGCHALILDTAGRLQIDQQMVMELVRVKQAANVSEILLVADSALGQEAVSVADHFHKALGLTGVILTKFDGDSRGGAALSIRKVTGCPIKFVGVGEKIDDLETFHPDRMASRILGMGDIVSLVEKAAEEIDKKEAEKLQEKLRKNQFDLNDFLAQLRQMKKLGGVESILGMLPGGKQLAQMPDLNTRQFSQMEAIICSMTTAEREDVDLIDFSRRKRIARGSGTTLEQVGQLVKQFSMMRKMMKKTGLFGRLASGAANLGSSLGGMTPPSMAGFSRGSNRTVSQKDKKKKRKR